MPGSAEFTEDIELPAGTTELVAVIVAALMAAAALAISLSLTHSRHVTVLVDGSHRAVEPAGSCVPQPHRPAYLILITRPAQDWLWPRFSQSWEESRAPWGVCPVNEVDIG